MLQPTTATRRRKPKLAKGQFLDPATIKERFYALRLAGNCLEPTFKDGVQIVIDREGPLHAGHFAVFYHRPELVPPGEMPLTCKRLVTAFPSHLTLPYREHPDSEVEFIVAVEQLNPRKRWVVRCETLLAVHRVLGCADDPKVQAKLAAEGLWVQS